MYTDFAIFYDSHVGDYVVHLFGPDVQGMPCAGGFRSRAAATRWAKRTIQLCA